MKRVFLMALIAISANAAACVAGTGEETEDGVEAVGEAHQELVERVAMGGLGWLDVSAETSGLILGHQVYNVQGKWASTASRARFPNLTGAYSAAKASQCADSYMDVYVYKRPGSSGSWTQIDHHKVYAKAYISNGQITDCVATYESSYCDPYTFPNDNEMEVDLYAMGGDAIAGAKQNTVRYENINLAACN